MNTLALLSALWFLPTEDERMWRVEDKEVRGTFLEFKNNKVQIQSGMLILSVSPKSLCREDVRYYRSLLQKKAKSRSLARSQRIAKCRTINKRQNHNKASTAMFIIRPRITYSSINNAYSRYLRSVNFRRFN